MLILSFDTTNEHGGAGIYRDTESLATIANPGGTNYSISLFDMVDHLLAETGLRLKDIELFAAANGPGSFTGIRVGLAAAQGWAKALGRQARGVSILEALVEAVGSDADLVLPLLDARRSEFYLCPFRRVGDARATEGGDLPGPASPFPFRADGGGLALKRADLEPFMRQLAAGKERSGGAPPSVCCVTRQQDCAAESLRGFLSGPLEWKVVAGTLVGAIARRARQAHQEASGGEPESACGLDAYYIRRSDAELHWKE
jgi:tRNA threonylcarbamoyl adenosine modification protein YeaZ